MGSNDKSVMIQDTNTNSNKSEDNEKLQPEDNNTQSINANNNDIDIQWSAQDSNTRSINESGMVQDGELPENYNLNTETKTHKIKLIRF